MMELNSSITGHLYLFSRDNVPKGGDLQQSSETGSAYTHQDLWRHFNASKALKTDQKSQFTGRGRALVFSIYLH